MRNCFTVEQVHETPTYKELKNKKEAAKCNFLTERTARQRITHAYLVCRNTGVIPNTVSGIYLSVVNDFLKLYND